MCIDYSGILCDAILEVRLLREKIISGNNNVSVGFLCKCKRAVLDYYITAISNFMLSLTEIFQDTTIKTETDLEVRFENLKDIFFQTNLSILSDSILNTKFISFFRLTHTSLEHIVFNNIYELLLNNFKNPISTDDICEECLDILYELAENAIIYLSGLRLNCNNLKGTILESFNVESFSICEDCSLTNNIILCPAKLKKYECIYLILIPYIFSHKNWLDDLLNTIITYHTNYKSIHFILDYKLLDPFKWDIKHEELYLRLKNDFDNIVFTNCIHIDFNEFSENKTVINANDLNCFQN